MQVAKALAVLSLLLFACNWIIGYDDLEKLSPKKDGGSSSSSGDDDTTGDDDEAGPQTRCDPTKPFGPPTVLSPDAQNQTKRALMTPDELELYYLLTTNQPFELRHALRDSRTADWKDPSSESLSPPATDLAAIVLQGKKLYYWDVDTTASPLVAQAIAATRPALKSAFSPGAVFPMDNTSPEYTVAENDDVAYYGKYIIDAGSSEELMYRASVNNNRSFDEEPVPNVHQTGAIDSSPAVNAANTVIYFSSSAKGSGGDAYIWRASRSSSAADWSASSLVTELQAAGLSEPSWVSADDCVLLFDRASHIFLAQRGR
jgi:hypothetical protein